MSHRYWIAVLASLVPGCTERELELPAMYIAQAPPVAPTLVGRRYYVSTAGSDRNPGTETAPLKSIQRAADFAGPGDTVIVEGGRYTGGERIVSVARGGSPGGWITFRAERKWEAVLDGRGGQSLVGWYFGPNVGYVRIAGFEIRGLEEHGLDFYGGRVHDLVIAGNYIHHIGRNCTDTSNGRTGASLGAGASRITLDGNVWHDIGRLAPGESGCRPKTEYYQNHDHGIYVADADHIVIRNNLFYNFRRGWAVHRYFSAGTMSQGLAIVGNTFVGANPYRPGQIILATPTAGLRIENNIFHEPRAAAIYFESRSFPQGMVQGNLVWGGSIKVGRTSGVTFSRNREQE